MGKFTPIPIVRAVPRAFIFRQSFQRFSLFRAVETTPTNTNHASLHIGAVRNAIRHGLRAPRRFSDSERMAKKWGAEK
jgi:hypothetical protein